MNIDINFYFIFEVLKEYVVISCKFSKICLQIEETRIVKYGEDKQRLEIRILFKIRLNFSTLMQLKNRDLAPTRS